MDHFRSRHDRLRSQPRCSVIGAAIGDGLFDDVIEGVARQPGTLAAQPGRGIMFIIIGLVEGMYFINLAFGALFVFAIGK